MGLIMIGNNRYSVMLGEYIKEKGGNIEAYFADREFITEDKIDDRPVYPLDEIRERYDPGDKKLVMGIGYKRLGHIRREIYTRCKNYGYSFINYIHPSAHIDPAVKIGEGNVIFENVVIQKNSVIGDCNLLFSNSTVMHDNKLGSFITMGAGSVSNGYVRIEDCCFIGSNATIKDSITISHDNLVGAGAYVNTDTKVNMAILPAKSCRIENKGLDMAENL